MDGTITQNFRIRGLRFGLKTLILSPNFKAEFAEAKGCGTFVV